jgi:iron complex outermembrane recepter protein
MKDATLKVRARLTRTSGWLAAISARAVLMAAAAAIPATAALAQTPSAGTGSNAAPELQEIVVTSRRYEENISRAPVAVSVMNAATIENQRIVTTDDVLQFSPGATWVRFNNLQPEYSIRGVNATAQGSSDEASIVTVIDDMPISKDFMKNLSMYDIERVEVLNGPQGTSFGRNAVAGLVQIVTKRPTDTFEGKVTTGIGNYGLAETNGFVNVPVSSALATRLAYNYRHDDGYMRSSTTGEGLNGTQNAAIRGSLAYKPDEHLDAYLKIEFNKDNDQAPVRRSRDCHLPYAVAGNDTALRDQLGIDPSMPGYASTYYDPCDPWHTDIAKGNFSINRHVLTVNGQVAWQFAEGYTLTSVTGYMDGVALQNQDVLGTPVNVYLQKGDQEAKIYTEEMRLDNHASSSRLLWLVGSLFMHDRHHLFTNNEFFLPSTDGIPAASLPRIPTFNAIDSRNTTNSIGIFGEASYKLTDPLTATFGVRWNHDHKSYEITNQGYGYGGPIADLTGCNFNPPDQYYCGTADNPVGYTTPVTESHSWQGTMYKASLQYQLNPEHMVYALFSQGYKTGGFQQEPPNVATALQPFDKETSNNYEIGWRGEFDKRLRISLTGFFLDLNGLQLNQFVSVGGLGFFAAISNAGKLQTYGAELQVEAAVTSDFHIGGTYSRQHAALKNTVVVLDTAVGPQDISGFRPSEAPTWTGSLNTSYDFHLHGGSMVTLQADARGRSDVWSDIINRDDPTHARLRPSVYEIGSRLTWLSADADLSVSLWVRNLTNQAEVIQIGPPQPNTYQLPYAYGPPRTFGADASYRF